MTDDLQARLEQALRERDEARADGARVAEVLQKACDSLFATGRYRIAETYQRELLKPHPGASMLRELLALRRVHEAWKRFNVVRPTVKRPKALAILGVLLEACAEADAVRQT